MECTKKAYATRALAQAKLEEIKSEGGDHKQPVREYMCDKCGQYHLTSWTKGKKRKVARIKESIQNNRIVQAADYWIRKMGWEMD